MGREIFKSKFVLIIGCFMLALIAFYLSKELMKKRQIDTEIAKLEAEIVSIEQRNRDILGLINYYKTREYKERQARSILGLQKEGEFAVALPQSKAEANSDIAEPHDTRSNLKKWWDYFFGS